MADVTSPLIPDCFYHIYNRGNNGIPIFYQERNYKYFLKLYSYHLSDVVDTYAYCLLNNHFHLLVQIKAEGASEQFRRFFIAYTKGVNNAVGRTGSIFENKFKRKLVDSDKYLTHLIRYIHRNAQHHQFVDDYRDWPWSSYTAIVTSGVGTKVKKTDVLEWFGGRIQFIDAHGLEVDEHLIAPLVSNDFV